MQPIDYTFKAPDPGQAFMQSLIAAQQQRAAQEAAQAKAAEKAEQDRALAELAANPNAGARDYARITARFPGLADPLKKSFDMLAPEIKQTRINLGYQAVGAVENGKPEVAVSILNRQAEAARSAGDENAAKAYETWGKLIEADPKAASRTVALMLSGVDEKFAENFGKINTEFRTQDAAPMAARKATADAVAAEGDAAIKTVQAGAARQTLETENALKAEQAKRLRAQTQNEAARLALDQDKFFSEVEARVATLNRPELDAGARGEINKAITTATGSRASAEQAEALANQFEKLGGGNGGFASAAERWAKLTGQQNAMTAARNEYIRLRNSQAVKMLPPGPATDKDIEMALSGFPPETADSAYVASFLRGMAKLNRVEAATEEARGQWISEVGSLSKPRRDIEVDGVQIAAGTNFNEFVPRYVKRKVAEMKFQKYDGGGASGGF